MQRAATRGVLALAVALQLMLLSTMGVFAASRASNANDPQQQVARAGAAIVRLLATYDITGTGAVSTLSNTPLSASPTPQSSHLQLPYQCTGLGVILASWSMAEVTKHFSALSTDNQNTWILTDSTIVNKNGSGCQPSNARLVSLFVYFSTIYNNNTLPIPVYKADPQANVTLNTFCLDATATCTGDSPVLFSFNSSKIYPYLDLAQVDSSQTTTVALTKDANSTEVLSTIDASNITQVAQYITPNSLPSNVTPEPGTPIVNTDGELVAMHIGNHTLTNLELSESLQRVPPLTNNTSFLEVNKNTPNDVHTNWIQGLAHYYQRPPDYTQAARFFHLAAAANTDFDGARQFERKANEALNVSKRQATPTPTIGSNINLAGFSIPLLPLVIAALIVLIILLILASVIFGRKRAERNRARKMLEEVERNATIDASRIAQEEAEKQQPGGPVWDRHTMPIAGGNKETNQALPPSLVEELPTIPAWHPANQPPSAAPDSTPQPTGNKEANQVLPSSLVEELPTIPVWHPANGAPSTTPGTPAEPTQKPATSQPQAVQLSCPNCHHPVSKGDNFCSHCRCPLSPSASGLHLRIPSQYLQPPAPAGATPSRSLADLPTVDMKPGQNERTLPIDGAQARAELEKTEPRNGQRSYVQYLVGTNTDPGIKRKHKPNEDSFFAAKGTCTVQGERLPFGLFVVADGMGGHAAGRDASRLAIQTIVNFMLPTLQEGNDLPREGLVRLLVDGVQHANQAVHQQNVERHADMGTTMTAALIINDIAYVTNVGDSRTYLFRQGEGLRKVTNDHSVVASLVEAGIIKPDDIYTHPKRNQIYRSLGEKPAVEIDPFEEQIREGDRFLLCSDGLWDMVRDPQIENIIKQTDKDVQSVADALIQAAYKGGGEDNVSVIVVGISSMRKGTALPAFNVLAKPDTVQLPQLT